VSKRERAAMAAASIKNPAPAPAPPVASSSSEMETAALNAKPPPRIQHKLDYYARETSARNRWPKEQTIHLKGHTKAVVGVRWSPIHGAPVSRSMTANFFTSQLWCYVYNNVPYLHQRQWITRCKSGMYGMHQINKLLALSRATQLLSKMFSGPPMAPLY
jgi:hypothetical protein